MKWIVLLKTVLDAAVAAGFLWRDNRPLAVMFAGFAVADAGAYWLAR